MVASRLYLFNGDDWKEFGSPGGAKLGSSAANHAERKLFSQNETHIKAAKTAAFVQDGAPCDDCDKFFRDKSKETAFIFAIGACGGGKEQGGTGYPVLPGAILIPSFVGEDGAEKPAKPFKNTFPRFFDSSWLPVLMYYHNQQRYVGALPGGFPPKGTGKLQTLLNAAK
jgi:hypothetical protein